MVISSLKFAEVAKNLLNQGTILYKYGGSDLHGMDSGGFIGYCLRQCGVAVSFSGTNDIYRNAGRVIPMHLDKAVPGVILLPITHDGKEPDRYRGDGYGNASYAAICYTPGYAAYPSEKYQKEDGIAKPPKRDVAALR